MQVRNIPAVEIASPSDCEVSVVRRMTRRKDTNFPPSDEMPAIQYDMMTNIRGYDISTGISLVVLAMK